MNKEVYQMLNNNNIHDKTIYETKHLDEDCNSEIDNFLSRVERSYNLYMLIFDQNINYKYNNNAICKVVE